MHSRYHPGKNTQQIILSFTKRKEIKKNQPNPDCEIKSQWIFLQENKKISPFSNLYKKKNEIKNNKSMTCNLKPKLHFFLFLCLLKLQANPIAQISAQHVDFGGTLHCRMVARCLEEKELKTVNEGKRTYTHTQTHNNQMWMQKENEKVCKILFLLLTRSFFIQFLYNFMQAYTRFKVFFLRSQMTSLTHF